MFGANTRHVVGESFVAVKGLNSSMFIVQSLDFGLEIGNREMGSMSVNDLSDNVAKQNDKGQRGQCHCKREVHRWFNL